MIATPTSLPALITPFKEDDPLMPINFDALQKLIEWHIADGGSGILLCGSTGESASMTEEEWREVVKFGVKLAKGKVHVMVGTGTNSTRSTVERTKTAQALGADSALIVTPYYVKPTQEGLYQHYKAAAGGVAAASNFPVWIYNVPGRTATDVLPQTVSRLVQSCPNLVGIKECSGRPERLQQLREVVNQASFKIFSGEDGEVCEMMLKGLCDGSISVTANVCPGMHLSMTTAAAAKKEKEARELNKKMEKLHTNLFIETNPTPVKFAVMKRGIIPSDIPRLPLVKLSEHHKDAITEAVKLAYSETDFSST